MGSKVIPNVVSGQTIRFLRPTDSAHDAARLMRQHDISAIVVVDDAGSVAGIVTEHDLAWCVVAENHRASEVRLAEVMTANPTTVAPAASPYEALETMRKVRVRHLPVVDGERIVGMVSMRDLRHAIGAATDARPKSRLRRLLRRVSGMKR